MKLFNIKKFFAACFAVVLLLPLAAEAFVITTMENVPVEGDFVLGPGKAELFLSPGESVSRDLTVTNRTGKALNIKIEIEDFTGDPAYSTKLLGNEKGPYSLKDYIKPEKNEFRLAHGERATLPVAISISNDAEPGGLYGAAIVRAQSESSSAGGSVEGAKGEVALVSRLATLFFVRVKGETKEEGRMKSFTADKNIYQKGPVNFSILYENTGSVHLNPYAEIEIKNALGKKVDSLEVAPWFVMPGFSRNRTVEWNKDFAFGRYTATLKLNRGYDNIVDEMRTSFWIVPVKVLAASSAAIFILAALIWLFTAKFEIKKKE